RSPPRSARDLTYRIGGAGQRARGQPAPETGDVPLELRVERRQRHHDDGNEQRQGCRADDKVENESDKPTHGDGVPAPVKDDTEVSAAFADGAIAVFALPEEVDAVGGGGETAGDLGPADGVVEQCLETGRQREVAHLPARGAHQVVVVVADGLGQLVPGEVVAGADASHDARLLERGEVAVERALRQPGCAAENLDDGEW